MKTLPAILLTGTLTGTALLSINSAQAAAVAAVIDDVVQIGCTVPGPSGASIYSVDNYKYNNGGTIDTIVLPTGVTQGAPCTAAVNAMIKDASDSCPGGSWQSGDLYLIPTPGNFTISGTGYSLQSYMFKCLAD